MNEEEAIEQLKIIKNNIDKKYINTKNSNAIETVLNLLEKKDEEIENKDKIINLMSEYISSLDIDEDICMKNTVNTELCNEEYSNCKECIKQYFERKLEEDK